jgi:hypothetical protein
VKFVVMIFFCHIKLSSGVIGKDVKPGEKFHPQQLFQDSFPAGKRRICLCLGLYRIIASRIRNHEVIQPRMATRSRVCRSRQIQWQHPKSRSFGVNRLQHGFFPRVVVIDCILLSGPVLAPMPFPCDSAQTT